MKVNTYVLLLVSCTACHAISLLGTTSIALFTLSAPVSGFFGMFRRRKSPVQETVAKPEPQTLGAFNRPQFGGFNLMNTFGGGMFFPGFNPGLGFGQRFPPQFHQPQQVNVPPANRFPPQMPPSFPPQMQQSFPPQPPVQQFPPGMSQNLPPMMDEDLDGLRDPREEAPGMNTEEAESFFTLLAETDESKCISRLVCEMGANPQSGGEFGQTIVEIIGSLTDFPDGSKVSEYNEVLNFGVSNGLSACVSKFSVCDEESFQLVKKAQVDDTEK